MKSSNVKRAIQNSAQTTAMAQGALSLINTASQSSIDAWKAVQNFENLYGKLCSPPGILPFHTFPSHVLSEKWWNLYETALSIDPTGAAYSKVYSSATSFSSAASAASKALKLGNMIIGDAFWGYTTHRFCEQLIDKFVNYYKENGSKIKISYEKAISYFEIPNDAQFKKICNSTESLKKQEKTRFSFDKLFLRKIFFALFIVIISIYICRHLFHSF